MEKKTYTGCIRRRKGIALAFHSFSVINLGKKIYLQVCLFFFLFFRELNFQDRMQLESEFGLICKHKYDPNKLLQRLMLSTALVPVHNLNRQNFCGHQMWWGQTGRMAEGFCLTVFAHFFFHHKCLQSVTSSSQQDGLWSVKRGRESALWTWGHHFLPKSFTLPYMNRSCMTATRKRRRKKKVVQSNKEKGRK